MKRYVVLGFILGILTLGVVFYLLGNAVDASTATTVPTVPCTGCGPSGSKGDGSAVWAYVEHRCLPNGTSQFGVVFGAGKHAGTGTGAYFYYAVLGRDPITQPLAFVKAGKQAQVDNVITVKRGSPVLIQVFANDGTDGSTMTFYDGDSHKDFNLVCDCPEGTTTTNVTIPNGSSSTTTPNGTVPVTTTVPVTLPPTL